MSTSPSVRVRLKRLIENPRVSVKIRLNALSRLQGLGAPVAMLERLMRDAQLPARLLAAVLDVYAAKQTIREHKRHKAAALSVLGTAIELSGES